MMKMKNAMKRLLSIAIITVLLAGMMIVPAVAEIPEGSVIVSYPTPGSRGTTVTEIDKSGNWIISANNTTGQKGGFIPLVGINNNCEGFDAQNSKFVATSFGVRGENAGAFADVYLTTTKNLEGTVLTNVKGKDTRYLDVVAVVDVVGKKVYVWNPADKSALMQIDLTTDILALNIIFREKWNSSGIYDKDIIISDYTQTVFTSEATTLDDVLNYVSAEKYIAYPSPEKRSGSTTITKGDKIGDWIFGNDNVSAQKAAFIPIVGTGKASEGFDAENTKYVVTKLCFSGDNPGAFNDINIKLNDTTNDVNGTRVTNLRSKSTSDLDVMTVTDVVNKKIYVWNLTSGELFEHSFDADIESLAFIFRENPTYNAVDINLNNLVQTVYTLASDITLDEVICENSTPFVKKRDNDIVVVNNNNGSYDLKYTGGTLETAKSQTSFYIKQNFASLFENGDVKSSAKYVKIDFVISSDYEIGSFTTNNISSASYDSIHGFTDSKKISIVWDVKNEKYYTYTNDVFSGLNMNLDKTTKASDYKFGVKLNFRKVDDAHIIGGADDITLATISNLTQSVYGAGVTLESMGLYTNSTYYSEGKYTIYCNPYGDGIKNGTESLKLNDANGLGATIFYAGYDENGEIVFITSNNAYENTDVESEEVSYIKAFVWKTNNIMPLMPAEGFVKIN